MKLADLKKRLKASEWNVVEFKESRTGLQTFVFETVSAFANMHGGWLVSRRWERRHKYAKH